MIFLDQPKKLFDMRGERLIQLVSNEICFRMVGGGGGKHGTQPPSYCDQGIYSTGLRNGKNGRERIDRLVLSWHIGLAGVIQSELSEAWMEFPISFNSPFYR